MKLNLSLCLTCFLIFSCSVENHKNNIPEKCLDLSYKENRTYIDIGTTFWELYKIEDLKNHSVYISENTINLNFYFSEKVRVSSIKNTQTYFSHIITETSKKNPSTYGDIYKFIKSDSIVKLRIFISNRLLLYTSFDFKTNQSDYYENIDINLDRTIKNPIVENFIEELKSLNTNIKNIKIFKSLKGSVICIIVYTKFQIDKIQEIEICKYVEHKIAPELEKTSRELYGMNMDALGLYLEIRSGNIEIFKSTYLNGDKKRWSNIDWNNFDFFNEVKRFPTPRALSDMDRKHWKYSPIEARLGKKLQT